MHDATDDHVAALRAFNRSYTAVMGFLDDALLRSDHSLPEARVIFELAQRDETDVADLRAALTIDAGQLSRILSALDAAGLVRRNQSSTDARRQRVALTEAGRETFADLDRRSNEQAARLLARLTDEDLRRLVGALGTVRELLDDHPPPRGFVIRGLQPGDLGWVVHRNGVLYAQEHGWDETYEALVAGIVADYGAGHDPRRENAWIAEVDGRAVGSVFCVRQDDTTAKLRLLLVEPSARGAGLGARLVDECIRFARAAGYTSLILWTNDVLVAARSIYQKAGFQLVDEQPHHSFGHDLVGQTWRLDLR